MESPGAPDRIENLTSEQEGWLAGAALQWMRIGLSVLPADRPRAERAIRTMYLVAGLRPPARIVWCGSPLSVELARRLACGERESAFRGRVPPSVLAWARAGAASARAIRPGAPVAGAVRREVMSRVAAAVEEGMGEDARSLLTRSVRKVVERQVDVPVLLPLVNALETALGGPAEDAAPGQHDAGWISDYAFLFARTGLRKRTARLRGLCELARSAGWTAPHEGICWVAERPSLLERDGLGRLHSERGPALRYPDGWAVHARGGVAVPPEPPAARAPGERLLMAQGRG